MSHTTESRSIEPCAIATPVLLQVESLAFGYPQRELFTDWSARIGPGVTLVRGGDGSGSGKTALLRLLAGDRPARSGLLRLHGVRLDAQPIAYRQQVFWADPQSQAFERVTALDYFESLRQAYPGFDDRALATLIGGLSLVEYQSKPLYMLSTGSKRKVWLAGAFASCAAVTLLDQPFAALDKASIEFVRQLLAQTADHPARAWVLADYEAPRGVVLAAVIELAG